MIDLKEILTASLVLFAVIDIIGNIPLIISLRDKIGHIQSEKASIIAAFIMIGFLFLGEEILKPYWYRHLFFCCSWFLSYFIPRSRNDIGNYNLS